MYKIVEKYEGVIIDKPINVKWGNYSQIKCEMLLFKEAFECPVNFDYYHLLSGVDLPLYLIRFNTYIVFSNCIKVLFLLLLMRIVWTKRLDLNELIITIFILASEGDSRIFCYEQDLLHLVLRYKK